ncbi:MAG: hypothetical protein R3313_02610 [Candidatus Saccharimonadales bacterium]|nr:hypothetical protein [Candidatus Saccharimonadales bacterium]
MLDIEITISDAIIRDDKNAEIVKLTPAEALHLMARLCWSPEGTSVWFLDPKDEQDKTIVAQVAASATVRGEAFDGLFDREEVELFHVKVVPCGESIFATGGVDEFDLLKAFAASMRKEQAKPPKLVGSN